MSERTYNAICRMTAIKMTRKLRRLGYQVRRDWQWVYVLCPSLDMRVSRIAQFYGAIAY